METLKQAPEISRVMPFYTDETLQIFGENLPQAVVYWWQPESGPMPASSAWETPTLPKTPPPDAVRLETVASFAQVLYARSKELRPAVPCCGWKMRRACPLPGRSTSPPSGPSPRSA